MEEKKTFLTDKKFFFGTRKLKGIPGGRKKDFSDGQKNSFRDA
jgi:hypothetical protein